MATPRLSKAQVWGRLLSFLAGLGLLAFLIRQLDLNVVLRSILQIAPLYLALGAGTYGCKALVRAFRIMRLNAGARPTFLRMFRLSLASSLASQLLPLKLGELSYIYLLKKENQASVSQGVSSLFILRLLDVLAIALLFVLFFLGADLPASLAPYFLAILAFFGSLLVALLALFIFTAFDEVVLAFFFDRLKLAALPLADKLRAALQGLFHSLKQYRPRMLAEALVLALLEWLINFSTFYFLLQGLGYPVDFFVVVTSVTFSALASLLPVNSFGNFGTQEAGWATAMLLFGYSQAAALASGFATHFVTVAYMLVAGGLAWLSYLFIGAKAPALRSDAGIVED
jgi:glycosyltransferase 2 family protein